MNKNCILALLLVVSTAFHLTAQQAENARATDHVEGEVLFQLGKNQSIDDFSQNLGDSLWLTSGFHYAYTIDTVALNLRIYSLKKLGRSMPSDDNLLKLIKSIPSVSAAQFNHTVELRGTPNDPLFSQQWNMQKVKAPSVWDVTTGGLTACGDTIVVAVIDGGFQTDLLDLTDNIWKNKGEIPNNGIDDDKNGYIDDVQGLNTFTLNDNHTAGVDSKSIGHGTACAGLIGASGNNSKLVTGVNWKIKLMLFFLPWAGKQH